MSKTFLTTLQIRNHILLGFTQFFSCERAVVSEKSFKKNRNTTNFSKGNFQDVPAAGVCL